MLQQDEYGSGNTTDIDIAYAAFCAHLPGELREVARTLGHRLGLVPNPAIPWSETFKHDVTLRAPALFADAMPEVAPELVQMAVTAHMLAVIEAFGTDRIADGQTADSPELRRVLDEARTYRNGILVDLGGAEASVLATEADERTREAIATERRFLAAGKTVSLEAYEAVSFGKQAVGLPACLVLARAAGFTRAREEIVRTTLMGIWLGLQFQDDVVDWEDDTARGGAWATLLATPPQRPLPQGDLQHLRDIVFGSGVLGKMLDRAVEQLRSASAGAEELGAVRLASWIAAQLEAALKARARERTSPGYLVRAAQLDAWAREVLGST